MRSRKAAHVDTKPFGKSRVVVRRAALQSIPAATLDVVLFNSVTLDTNGEYTPATGRFSPRRAGTFRISSRVLFSSLTWPTTRFDLEIRHNGTRTFGSLYTLPTALDGFVQLHVQGLIALAAGDTIDVRCGHPSLSSETLHSDGNWTFLIIDQVD